jgi:hypothetical protein
MLSLREALINFVLTQLETLNLDPIEDKYFQKIKLPMPISKM